MTPAPLSPGAWLAFCRRAVTSWVIAQGMDPSTPQRREQKEHLVKFDAYAQVAMDVLDLGVGFQVHVAEIVREAQALDSVPPVTSRHRREWFDSTAVALMYRLDLDALDVQVVAP